MPPVLLFRESADGEVGVTNLSARTPAPGPGSPAEYVGAANRYRVHPDGHIDANGITASIARWPDVLIPPGTTFRIVMDVYREGADGVAGYMSAHAYVEDGLIAAWDFLDNLEMQIRRNSLTLTDARMTWKKDSSEPPPAETNLALAGSITHGPNTGVRYEFEVDEGNRIVRIYVATFDTVRPTFGTPEDIAPSAAGTLPDELAAHLTANRLIGINTIRASSGAANFRLYNFEVWDMGVTAIVTGAPCTLLLTVYADDGVTPLWSVATDPAHSFPYLEEPEDYGEQELDIANGSASIATIRYRIVDKETIPGDQDSGFMTEKLASLNIPAIGGHRCELTRFDPNGVPVVIVDGPSGQPALASYSAYEGEIRDTRENERKIRLFDVVGPTVPVVDDAAATGPTQSGWAFGFTWGTKYP